MLKPWLQDFNNATCLRYSKTMLSECLHYLSVLFALKIVPQAIIIYVLTNKNMFK